MKRAPDAPITSLPVESVRVGKRYRQHMGDIDGLAQSIADHGLLHPIVVTPERLLIAGERRLLAVKSLGWSDVPVTVLAPKDLLGAEAAENRDRLNFTPSEAVAIAKALEPIVAAPVGRPEKSAQIAPTSLPQRTRDRVAAAVGMSSRTLEKAAAVVAAVEADPELALIADEMDASGNVDRAFRKVQAAAEPDHAAVMATEPPDERATAAYRWVTRMSEAAASLLRLGYTPTLDMSARVVVPLLTASERESTERYLGMIEDWTANTRHVLRETGALHVVGGRS